MAFTRKIAAALLIMCLALSTQSCSITMSTRTGTRHDNGKHKGWFKNPKNPHNPAHKPGNGPGNNPGNGKNKKK